MTLVLGQRERGLTRNVQVLDAAGDVITPGVNDLVRVRIGRQGQPDVLSVTSGSPTVAGSKVTKGATNVVRLDADDLNFPPGTYTFFVEYFDNADAREWKEVDRECLVLEPTS